MPPSPASAPAPCWIRPKLIIKIRALWVTPVWLTWLMKESCHMHWCDSWDRCVAWCWCGATSALVAPVRLVWLSCTDCCDVTDRAVPSDVDWVAPCWTAWLTKELRQPPWRDSSVEYGSPSFLFFPPLFLSSLLLYSPHDGSISDFEFSPKIWAFGARNRLYELVF
jgi:hypothetical protein